MAENLGASFSIDVTNLKAGLATANKLIRESESEFKAAAAGMDDWQSSSEGLSAQIKNLTTVTGLQQQKVDALTEQYDNLISEGLDPTSDKAVQLRTQINNETAALNKNKQALDKAEKALNELGDTSDEAADATEDVGDAAEDAADGVGVMDIALGNIVANGFSALIGACKNAIGSLLGLSNETQHIRSQMAKLETGFETSGLSAADAAETYAELYGVLADEDKATEAAAFLGQLANSEDELSQMTNILTGVYATFGDALPVEGLAEAMNHTAQLGSVQGNLADALEWAGLNVDDFNVELEKCNSVQERQALITDTLNGIYSEASNKYKEVNKDVIEANKAQARFTDAQAELGKKMQPVSTALKNAFGQILEKVLELTEGVDLEGFAAKITAAFDTFLNEGLPKILNGLQWLKDNIPTIATVVGGLTAAIVAQTAANKIKAITDLAAANGMNVMTMAQNALNAAMKANPIGLVITVITLLVAAFVYLWNNCESLRKFWIKTWETIKNTFVSVWQTISTFFTVTIPETFTKLAAMAKEKSSLFLENVVSFFRQLPNKIWTYLTNTLSKVAQFGSNLATKGTEAAKGLYDSVVDGVKGLPDKMLSIGSDIVDGIWEGIKGGWDWLTNKVSKLADSLFKAAKKALDINSPSKKFAYIGVMSALGVEKGWEDEIDSVKQKISGSLNTITADGISANIHAGTGSSTASGGRSVVVNQTNNYSQAHSRFEIYKSKKETEAAVKLAILGV